MTTFTPQEEKVYAALSKILTNEFDIPAEKIRPEARLCEDFDIDSIDAVDMIVQLKPYLGNRTVKPEAFKAVRTLGDVVSVIAKIMENPILPPDTQLSASAMALPLKAVLRAAFGTVLVLYPFWAWYGLSHWGPAAVAAGLAAVTFCRALVTR